MANLELRHVHRNFRDKRRETRALNDVSFRCEDGELLVLVGPSGCGKTTTLRLIAGLDEVTSGEILIDDRVVNRVEPRDRDVAMVFQNYALYPHMTVAQNIGFPLKMRRLKRAAIRDQVAQTAQKLGLTAILERKPAELSGGERQRTAIGRAIVRHPKIFLFDEPLSNLDAHLRVGLRTEIKRLQRELRATTIYVTHDQEDAMLLGDRIAVMKDGVIQQCGTPLEVYNRPANFFVARFVGTPAINCFEARIDESGLRPDGRVVFWAPWNKKQIPMPSLLKSDRGSESVQLAIRPQHVHLGASANGERCASLGRGKVMMIETTGDATNVYLQLEGAWEIVARAPTDHPPRTGEEFDVHIDGSKLHVFANDDAGQRLNSET